MKIKFTTHANGFWEKYDIDDDVDYEFTESQLNAISGAECLTEKFMRKYKDQLNWRAVTANNKMSVEFILEHENYVDWAEFIYSWDIPIEIIEKHFNKIDWNEVSENITSEVFCHHDIGGVYGLEKYAKYLNWKIIKDDNDYRLEELIEYIHIIKDNMSINEYNTIMTILKTK